MKDRSSRIFSTALTKEQSKDSGMAVVLILLLIGFFIKDEIYFRIAVFALLIDMIVPVFFYPFAIIWYGLANIMGVVFSKVILSLVFFMVVLPVAIWRRLSGKDSLKLKKFKEGSGSVMKTRDHVYSATDLENPF